MLRCFLGYNVFFLEVCKTPQDIYVKRNYVDIPSSTSAVVDTTSCAATHLMACTRVYAGDGCHDPRLLEANGSGHQVGPLACVVNHILPNSVGIRWRSGYRAALRSRQFGVRVLPR